MKDKKSRIKNQRLRIKDKIKIKIKDQGSRVEDQGLGIKDQTLTRTHLRTHPHSFTRMHACACTCRNQFGFCVTRIRNCIFYVAVWFLCLINMSQSWLLCPKCPRKIWIQSNICHGECNNVQVFPKLTSGPQLYMYNLNWRPSWNYRIRV